MKFCFPQLYDEKESIEWALQVLAKLYKANKKSIKRLSKHNVGLEIVHVAVILCES